MPFLFRSISPVWNDQNLLDLSRALSANLVRATALCAGPCNCGGGSCGVVVGAAAWLGGSCGVVVGAGVWWWELLRGLVGVVG